MRCSGQATISAPQRDPMIAQSFGNLWSAWNWLYHPTVRCASYHTHVLSYAVYVHDRAGCWFFSQASALRHKHLQFRHRMHKTTHKSAGLVRLISVMKEKDGRTASRGPS